MVKGLIRFALIWALSALLAPYVARFFERVAARAPQDSVWREILDELSGRYSASLIRSLGETVGELVLGPKSK